MRDIAEWLGALGLGRYTDAFAENDIDGDILLRLTNDDLREIGVSSVGHRRKLLEELAQVSLWLRSDIQGMSEVGPRTPQQATFDGRCPLWP